MRQSSAVLAEEAGEGDGGVNLADPSRPFDSEHDLKLEMPSNGGRVL